MGIMTKLYALLKTRIWKSTLDDSTRKEMYCELEQSVHKVGRTLTNLLDDCENTILTMDEAKQCHRALPIVKYASAEAEKKTQLPSD